jgi:hypothetical protein
MKKQQFKTLEHYQTLQILGGITDPNLDPDAGYVVPADDPVPPQEPDDPVNDEPDPTRPRTKATI